MRGSDPGFDAGALAAAARVAVPGLALIVFAGWVRRKR